MSGPTESGLTEAERAVLELAGRGLTVEQSAQVRRVSRHTVAAQRRRILSKLRARTIAQAIQIVADRRGQSEAERALSANQLVAIQARSADVDRRLGRASGDSKRLALEAASAKFKRELAHTDELRFLEASWILDRLRDELESVAA